jgi:cyclohexanone monooxygenase
MGMSTPGFPNMLMITGPLSPIGNLPPMIEEHVEYVGQLIKWMEDQGMGRVEASPEAAQQWTYTCDAIVAGSPILRGGASAGSWYFGTNVPGKPERTLYFFGGMHEFHKSLIKSRDNGFEGLQFS